ncbi:hypothetical protein [Legionella hackeliae]|uniref:hypothetical protein n=1 Tax=Legionella hackeliae TaxID=449 RepID=UPI00211551DA|nr:hypothetical protein [Legionella hackeliae]
MAIAFKSLFGEHPGTRYHSCSFINALDAMVRKGIKEETRKALTTLNLMLDYGLTRHLVESNPARMLKPKDFFVTAAKPRDRVLALPELRELWKALEQANDLASTTIFPNVSDNHQCDKTTHINRCSSFRSGWDEMVRTKL